MAHFLVRFHRNFSIATRLATVAPSCPAGSWSDATMGQPTTLVAHSTPPQQHRPNKRMWPPFFVTPGRGTKPYWALHSEGHTWLAQLGELLVGAAVVGCALRGSQSSLNVSFLALPLLLAEYRLLVAVDVTLTPAHYLFHPRCSTSMRSWLSRERSATASTTSGSIRAWGPHGAERHAYPQPLSTERPLLLLVVVKRREFEQKGGRRLHL